MAERKFDFVETLGRKVRMIAGSFAPDTANPPTTVRGSGFTVARTAQGVFTITFRNAYAELISAVATVQLASTDDRKAQIGTYDATARNLVIRVQDDAGAGAEQ